MSSVSVESVFGNFVSSLVVMFSGGIVVPTFVTFFIFVERNGEHFFFVNV